MTDSHKEYGEAGGDAAPRGVVIFRRVFGCLLAFWILAFLLKTMKAESKIKLTEMEIAYNFILDSVAYFGLYKRKSWVIPFILIYSAWNFLSKFLHVIGGGGTSVQMLGMKAADLLMALVYLYMIVYFRKNEVSSYFKSEKQILV